jgi:hypothetical protein
VTDFTSGRETGQAEGYIQGYQDAKVEVLDFKEAVEDLLRLYELTGDHDHGGHPRSPDDDCIACRVRRLLDDA